MPVKSFWIITNGLPTESHSCSSLTGPSTQDVFEIFHLWAVNFLKLLTSYPDPSGSFKAQFLIYIAHYLTSYTCRCIDPAQVYLLTAAFISSRPYYKSFNSCHNFGLTSYFYYQLSNSSFSSHLQLEGLSDNERTFWGCQKETEKWDQVFEKLKNKELKDE